MRGHAARLLMIFALLLTGIISGCVFPDHWYRFSRTSYDASSQQRKPPLPSDVKIGIELPTSNFSTAKLKGTASRGPLALSLEEAVLLALKNNPDFRVRQLDPVITGTFEKIERGEFDPEFFSEGQYFEERAREVARSTGSQFSVEGSDVAIEAGLRQRLPTGTSFEATVTHERSISDRAPEQQSARVGISVTQSLLRGFGPRVNLVRVRQAELDTKISRYELRGFIESLLAETEAAYWELFFAAEEIDIFEQSLEFARKQCEETALRIEVGMMPEIESAAAEAEVARHRQALIDARARLEERRLRLLRLLSPGPFGNYERIVETTSSPAISASPLNEIDARIELAQQLRPDLREALLRAEQRRLETIVTRNGVLPRLDFFIGLGRSGYADTFSDSFRELDGNNYDLSAGFRFSSMIGNRAAKARDLAAAASRRQSAEAIANLRQLLRLDVRLAVNEVERARRQIEASRTTRKLEEKTVQAEVERFNVGAGTSLLVARAQRDLVVSRIAEVRAVVDFRRALVNLYLAEGSLMARRGIAAPDLE